MQDAQSYEDEQGNVYVRDGNRWRVERPKTGGWQVRPYQTPSDARADQRLSLAEESSARSARSEERAVANEERSGLRQDRALEIDLRKEFQSLPDVKDYQAIRASYENVRATAQNDSAAGDLSLIFAFMKILDPTSVVREQEFANAQNAGGIPDQVRNAYNRALNGERLSPRQRADFLTQAGSIFQNRTAAYNQAAERYRGLAEEYGAVPDRVALLADAPPPIEIPQAQTREDQAAVDGGATAAVAIPVDAEGVADWSALTGEQRMAIRAGQKVRTPTGEIVTARSQPTVTERRPGDRQAGEGLFLREPNALDATGAFVSAAAEQIPGLDEAAIAADAALSGQTYSEASADYSTMKSMLNQSDRGARVAGGLVGAGATILAPGGLMTGRYIAAAPSLAGAVGRGAMVGAGTGAVYGAGAAEGGPQERLQGAQDGAFAGGLTGGVLSGGGRMIGNAVGQVAGSGAARQAQVSMLRDNGVFMTPGQRMGGLAKTAEDLAMRAPILGTAVRGARSRAQDSFARGADRINLAAIGQDLPDNIPAGADTVAYTSRALGSEFDRAADMVPQVSADDTLWQNLSRIGQQKADLPPPIAEQFDQIVANRLGRVQGTITGRQLREVEKEITQLASNYTGAADPAQQQLGRMLTDVGGELQDLLSRTNPEAGRVLDAARQGWGGFARTRRASAAAGGRPFTPSQFETAVRMEDGSVARGAVGRGEAVMQDYARAGKDILSDGFGNPGTADAIGLGALATGAVTAPATTAVVAGGLAAAAAPYFLMGRQVLARAAANPTPASLQAAEQELAQLAAKDPKVVELTSELRRLYQGGSAVAGNNAPERPRLMTGGM